MIVINAENKIVGRIASFAAEKALLGETVHIINSEKALLTGPRAYNIENLAKHINLTVKGNPLRSPKYSKMPDQILRIAVRGMLPKKSLRGKAAWKRVRTHVGIPASVMDKTITEVPRAAANGRVKTTTLGELSDMMGAHFKVKA